MKRYELSLIQLGSDVDDTDPDELVVVRGNAATCRSVLAEIAAELGANGLSFSLGYSDAVAAVPTEGVSSQPTSEHPVFADAEPVKRKRRSKAEIEADRIAAGQQTPAAAETQPVDAPAPVAAPVVATPGNFGPGQPAVPVAPAGAVPDGNWNPFDPNAAPPR